MFEIQKQSYQSGSIAKHLTDELLQATGRSVHSSVNRAITRQQQYVAATIQAALDNGSDVDAISQHLTRVVEFSNYYEGKMPHWDSIGEAINELADNPMSSADRHYQMEQMGERHLLDIFAGEKQARVESPHAQHNGPTAPPAPPSHLEQAWDANNQKLENALHAQDEEGIRAAERNLDLIEEQYDREQEQSDYPAPPPVNIQPKHQAPHPYSIDVDGTEHEVTPEDDYEVVHET